MNGMNNAPIILPSGLQMRSVRDAQDAQRYSDLSGSINGQHEDEMCAQLLCHHPYTTYDDYVVVEDTAADRLVSSTCLIPWQLHMCGVPLRAAMLEMVVTHPDYRRRGLVREQINHFHSTVSARGFDISIIQGIAYYYRQFGYAYALGHRPFDSLSVASVPPVAEESVYKSRIASLQDYGALTAVYQRSIQAHDLYVLRDDAYWRFLLSAPYYSVRIIEHKTTHAPEAYAILQPQTDDRFEVVEAAAITQAGALALLQHLREVSTGELRLPGTLPSVLIQAARSLSSHPLPSYQWLLRITDVASLLRKLSAVFNTRLADSSFRRYDGELRINLFNAAYCLRFVNGQLQGVDDLGFVDASLGADGGDLCIPPDAFTRLLFGYRTLDQLLDAWPDTIIKAAQRDLLNILFPQLDSCIWMPY